MTTRTRGAIRPSQLVYAAAALIAVSLIAAACGGQGSADLPAPPVTESPPPPTKASTPSPANQTTAEATPETTTTSEAPRLRLGPFPETVPPGECTKESIRTSTGVELAWGPECFGPWAVGQGDCPPNLQCEGIDVLRWTDDGWQYRDLHNSFCVWSVQMSGMPPAINDQLIGFNTECADPISFSAEPASGPLSVGDEGPRVAKLQQALIDLRLLDDIADGYFGPNTYSAVIDFQFLASIEVSGQADGPTHELLGIRFD